MSEALAVNKSIATTMLTQVSSTAQDLARGKMTEIDFLNGYIVELGKRYKVATPYNESVYALVKMLESQIK
jgi:2-dehydropantoate 2-reductase